MDMIINLAPQQFGAQPDEIFRNADFVVTAFHCALAGPMLTLANSRGSLRILPYRGLTIWDADFDGYSLKSGRRSVRTASCKPENGVAFHSPWPHQDEPLLDMQCVGLQIEGDTLTLHGSGELAQRHCRLRPAVRLTADSAQFSIDMQITNLADAPLPLNYVCQLNYGCIPAAIFRQNLPAPALTPPGSLAARGVLCSDDLSLYVDQAEFFMLASKGRRYVTRFSTAQFNYGLRPIAQQGNQRLFRFIQPATSSLQMGNELSAMVIEAGKTREFCVTTGGV
ncbi:hypothetical protein [Serratia quinivorans]|uniref:hypothetical protein n=1 Tax=Serratia quinivorans TaxID=137545 RepID=UPI003F9B69AF